MKVGILLDDLTVPHWIAMVVSFLEKNPEIKVEFVVTNNSKIKGASSSLVYRALRMVDRKLFKAAGNPFKKEKLIFENIDILAVTPEQTRFSDRFTAADIAKIKKYEVDFILRFGFRILRGDILQASKYGILSLHHGDTDTYRGGPPAFWEVVNKSPETCVSLQLLTETLDGGVVVDKAFQRTDTTGFYRNQSKLYYAGVEIMTHFLSKCVQFSSEVWIDRRKEIFSDKIYSDRLHTNPTNKEAFQIGFRFFVKSASRAIYHFFFSEQWQIIVMKSASSWNQLAMYRSRKMVPAKDRIWADPFSMQHEGKSYLFFEEFIHKNKKAHISYFELDANLKPTTKNPIIAINEKFHLSYPSVFKIDNDYYCCPESASNKSLTLYKAEVFPNQWKPIKTLFEETKIYDPTFVQHDGTWYLFCNKRVFAESSSDMYLHIYYADDILNEPLKSHPSNP
ncbi:MAG: hypothetical protein V4535_08030, partial [Bacteroidota bacterium]